ncbi:hypothetical protein MUG87_03925 [Ectobacillus sp. JY-23]|uniref:hypothetical protein n=1 Tax=Ectobacillus sp. JY-23 TaxID=2933872 RepID=UPI001FF5A580|nr:hypothetical protein [Ectobacillus sp. JY-23]UOY93287.1 hypothetical protein MUG87_03925 [Ectobacillus sp. JY-23]
MKGKLLWGIIWFVIICGAGAIGYFGAPYIMDKKQIGIKKETASAPIEEATPAGISDSVYAFVSTYHKTLNDLTGWGQINSPEWTTVHTYAGEIVKKVDEMQYAGDANLEQDLKAIRQLAADLQRSKSKRDLTKLHRYFHDLDVVMNRANGDGNYYKVSKWGNAHK